MTSKKVKSYDREFKENAVKLVVEQKMKVAEVSRDLGVGLSTLQAWLRMFRSGQEPRPSPQHTHKSSDQLRIEELEKQNRRLTMERDIVKKALAYFAELPK